MAGLRLVALQCLSGRPRDCDRLDGGLARGLRNATGEERFVARRRPSAAAPPSPETERGDETAAPHPPARRNAIGTPS